MKNLRDAGRTDSQFSILKLIIDRKMNKMNHFVTDMVLRSIRYSTNKTNAKTALTLPQQKSSDDFITSKAKFLVNLTTSITSTSAKICDSKF